MTLEPFFVLERRRNISDCPKYNIVAAAVLQIHLPTFTSHFAGSKQVLLMLCTATFLLHKSKCSLDINEIQSQILRFCTWPGVSHLRMFIQIHSLWQLGAVLLIPLGNTIWILDDTDITC